MLPTLCLVVCVVALLAALGRSATPRAERLPWTRWTAADLLRNVVLGWRLLAELDQRNPTALRRHTPFHG